VFLSADGACTTDPLKDTCVLGTVPATETRVWNLHYKMGDFPATLISSDEPLSVTVFRDPDAATDPIDPNPDNDFAQTKSFVKKSVGSCSTGGMGGALGLLVLAVPFLRRRRKS
jgi:MYXO-CTERM domain-containing protein